MKTIGGWGLHNKANPRLDFNTHIKCGCCNKKFKANLSENVETEEALIFIKTKKKTKGFSLFSQDFEKEIHEQVTLYKSVCPNCRHKKELFCISQNPEKIIEGEWKNTTRDF